MATYLSDELRARIEEADGDLCRYCLVSETNSGMPLTFDHIEPRSKGGLVALRMNRPAIATARGRWAEAGGTTAGQPGDGDTPARFSARCPRRVITTTAATVTPRLAAVATQPQTPMGGRLPSMRSATSRMSEPR